jgi:hypothetical protein
MTKNPAIFPWRPRALATTLLYVRPRAPARWLARA